MKKTSKTDPLAPRPDLDFRKGVRGQYTNLLAEGTNIVVIDPSLLTYFPDSESVNRALHAFLAIGNSIQSAVPTRRTSKRLKASFDPRVGIAAKLAPRR